MNLNLAQITQWNAPTIDVYKDFYKFLNYIDPLKTQFLLNMGDDNFDDFEIEKEIVIFSTFVEAPRNEKLVELAIAHPEVQFICLADVEFYNYPLPSNVTFFKYRHCHILLNIFLQNGGATRITPVKSKNISKKFSSRSFWNKQIRALVTACLLKYARDDSIISWHNRSWMPHHDYLIDTIKQNPRYKDLAWDLLDNVYLIDEWYASEHEYAIYMSTGSLNTTYQTSLINFSNESTNFGLYQIDNVSYIRPGPFLTEKTWNPLIAGNILFSTAAPYVYQYLINDYHIPINYSIGLDFDYIQGDLDRFDAICKKIQELVDIPLNDLIDQNIDNCELIQKTVLNPDYIKQFDQYNRQQDLKILEKIYQIA
jgi:hypothetical protein